MNKKEANAMAGLARRVGATATFVRARGQRERRYEWGVRLTDPATGAERTIWEYDIWSRKEQEA